MLPQLSSIIPHILQTADVEHGVLEKVAGDARQEPVQRRFSVFDGNKFPDPARV